MMFLKNIFKSIIIKNIISTTTLSFLGKAVGAMVPFFIAAWFGVSVFTDIFFFAYSIVIYLANIFTISIESNIVPYLARLKEKAPDTQNRFINSILTVNFIFVIIVTGLFFLFLKPFVSMANNFPQTLHPALTNIFIELWPIFLLLITSSILSGVLNAYFKFWLPAISPGVRAIVCLIVVFIFKNKLGIHALVLGYIMGEFARLIFFLFYLIKNNLFKLEFKLSISPSVKKFLSIMVYQIISLVVVGLNPVVDNIMSSWLNLGSVSILQYAYKLYYIPVTFVSSGLIVVILSRWSEDYYKSNDIMKFKNTIYKTLKIVFLISVGLLIGFGVFSRQVVVLSYLRGKFPETSIGMVQITFLAYLAGLVFDLLCQVLVRAHLVFNKTKVLLIVAVISNVTNITLNYILMKYFGVVGIALATSITVCVMLLYLYAEFIKEVRYIQKAKGIS